MEQKLRRRRVLELPSRLAFAITRRVYVANEMKDVDIVVESVEKVDGSKPSLLIRIKRVLR